MENNRLRLNRWQCNDSSVKSRGTERIKRGMRKEERGTDGGEGDGLVEGKDGQLCEWENDTVRPEQHKAH